MMESCCQSTDLRQPLLADAEIDYGIPLDDEADESLDHNNTPEDNYEYNDNNEQGELPTWMEDFIVCFVLPMMLFLQFGMVYWMHLEPASKMQVPSWTLVNVSILQFVVTSWLYRRACQDANISSHALCLLPEILLNVVLVLILCNGVRLGYHVLIVGTLLLAMFVALCTSVLYCRRHKEQEQIKLQVASSLLASSSLQSEDAISVVDDNDDVC